MLTTAEHLEQLHRLGQVDLTLIETEDIENLVTNSFLTELQRRGVNRMIPLGGSPDYAVQVDVTDNVPDLGPNPWFSTGYLHLGYAEVYMVRVAEEIIAGRTIWFIEAAFVDGLPKRKGGAA